MMTSFSYQNSAPNTKKPRIFPKILVNCTIGSMAQACPANHPTTSVTGKLSVEACPEYFRWIHEDLRPWKSTGISRFAVESAKGDADFRLVIVNGKAYVEQYRKSFQTTDLFTMWGIFQLLKLYPNRLPELGKRIQWRVQELQSSRSMHPQVLQFSLISFMLFS